MGFCCLSNEQDAKIVIIMVGLPARGKTLISQKIARYLSWLSIKCKCFSTYSFCKLVHESELKGDSLIFEDGNIFEMEDLFTNLAFKDILRWFQEPQNMCSQQVAVLDSTNIRRESREKIIEKCQENNLTPMFVESWCNDNDHAIIISNINESLEVLRMNDEIDENRMNDMRITLFNKIKIYEDSYQSLDHIADSDITFIKLINFNESIIMNKIKTYLQSKVIFFLISLQIKPKYIWLSRHGESQYNLAKKIGGDSSLSERGLKYAQKLKDMIIEHSANNPYNDSDLVVWTSTLKRTQETAQYLPNKKLPWKALDELYAGSCDGMTYEEIERDYPEDFKARDDNKFEYRYHGGESYKDVVIRLEPVIMELERQDHVLIVTHQAVLRCIYAYFMNVPQEECPWVSIPLHTLIRLEVKPYGTDVTYFKANIPAVSTYKMKGTSQIGEDPKSNNIQNSV